MRLVGRMLSYSSRVNGIGYLFSAKLNNSYTRAFQSGAYILAHIYFNKRRSFASLGETFTQDFPVIQVSSARFILIYSNVAIYKIER